MTVRWDNGLGDEAVRLRRSGLSILKTAERVGVSHMTTARFLRAAAPETSVGKHSKSPWPARDSEMMALRAGGLTYRQVGEAMGLSRNAIVGRADRLRRIQVAA